jgi:hypothetical protein
MNTYDFANSIILRQYFFAYSDYPIKENGRLPQVLLGVAGSPRSKLSRNGQPDHISLEGGQQPPKGFWVCQTIPKTLEGPTNPYKPRVGG